jgi:hypothetical protein
LDEARFLDLRLLDPFLALRDDERDEERAERRDFLDERPLDDARRRDDERERDDAGRRRRDDERRRRCERTGVDEDDE